MTNIKTLSTNIRKCLITLLWAVVGLCVIILDKATVGAISRSMGSGLETFCLQGIERLLSMSYLSTDLWVKLYELLQCTLIIIKMLAILTVIIIPVYVVLFNKTSLSDDKSIHANDNNVPSNTRMLHTQPVYILQDKFIC